VAIGLPGAEGVKLFARQHDEAHRSGVRDVGQFGRGTDGGGPVLGEVEQRQQRMGLATTERRTELEHPVARVTSEHPEHVH
jgi:hypothetical protein